MACTGGEKRTLLTQQLLNGLVVGGVYALFAVGFTRVFGIHKVLNLAHGGVFMVGAFVGLIVVELGLPFGVALLVAMLAGGVLSVAIERICFRPLRNSGEEEFGSIISSIGANLIIISIAQQLSNTQIQRFPFGTFPIYIFEILGLRLSALQVFMTLAAVILVGLLSWYLYRTAAGRRVRAVAENERAAKLVGINPNIVYLQTFFAAGALAAAAGVFVGLAFNTIHFMMGEPYLLRGFIVVILGGLGSLPGALIGAMVFGVLQTLSVAYLPTEIGDILLFTLLFLILLLRPNGLLGQDAAGSARATR